MLLLRLLLRLCTLRPELRPEIRSSATSTRRQARHAGVCTWRRGIGHIHHFDVKGQAFKRRMTRHRPVVVSQVSGDKKRALTTLLELPQSVVPTRDDLASAYRKFKRLVARARHIRFKYFITRKRPAGIPDGYLFAGV